MKTISQQQIEEILKALYQINPPVQFMDAMTKLFESLPEQKQTNEQGTKEV